MTDSTGRKSIQSYIKHEDLVEAAVRLGRSHGLAVDATQDNDPKGDIRVAGNDVVRFLALLGRTIDEKKAERER